MADIYDDLRLRALDMTEEKLGLPVAGEPRIFGIVMDWNLGPDRWVTLTSFLTGDASIYFSNGGGIIGGVQHEVVRLAAKKFVESAESLVSRARSAVDQGLPMNGARQFTLLSRAGNVQLYLPNEGDRDGDGGLSALDSNGQAVISALRSVSNKDS